MLIIVLENMLRGEHLLHRYNKVLGEVSSSDTVLIDHDTCTVKMLSYMVKDEDMVVIIFDGDTHTSYDVSKLCDLENTSVYEYKDHRFTKINTKGA